MLCPSKHYVQYDAVTYQDKGFTVLAGRVCQLSKKPRYWKINVCITTKSPAVTQVKSYSFTSPDRFKLSELGQIVNQEIHKYLRHLTECTSCIVTAYILTEGGK